ncbi:MAG: hypothetical protein KA247_10265, partial [Bacteroidetes bacterium]|nr:hypothetical protein [Bacteroidota bacterium]
MGNQQILLIILGMIIVGVAITVAIILVNENAVTANRDAIAADLLNLSVKAQQYYNTPSSMAGGGHSYLGLTADAAGMLRLVSTAFSTNGNGVYTIRTAGNASQVVFQGEGNAELSD